MCPSENEGERGFVMKTNLILFLASCAMAQSWGMEELSFILHDDDTLEMEGNYSLHLGDNGWGTYPSQQDFAVAKSVWEAEATPWPFKPAVIYNDRREIVFEAGY